MRSETFGIDFGFLFDIDEYRIFVRLLYRRSLY